MINDFYNLIDRIILLIESSLLQNVKMKKKKNGKEKKIQA